MAESSSESEQSFDIDNVHQDNREHVRQVLSKGKQIAPFYNDFVLFELYKRYYQADNVFFNQLRIISKRRKDAEQEGGWVTVGKQKKAKSRRSKFNFLEDKRLIWRATNWDKEQAKDRTGRDQKRVTRDNPQTQNKRYKPKAEQQTETKKEIENRQDKVQIKKKQPKFKEKTEEDTKQKIGEPEKPEQTKKTQYAEKKQTKNGQKYAQKQVNASKPAQTKNVQNKTQAVAEVKVQNVQKYQQKPIGKPSQPVVQPVSKEEKKQESVKKQQKVPEQKYPKEEKVARPVEQTKPVEVKPVQQPKVKVQQQVTIKKQEKSAVKQVLPIEKPQPEKVEKVSEETTKTASKHAEPQKLDPETIKKNFQESCKKYPKVLKFIAPSEKMSKVSYEWINGSINAVKVHVPLVQPQY